MASRGTLYMAISAFGFSIMSMLVKLASTRLPIGEIVLARGVVTLVISYVMVVHAGLSPYGKQRGRLVLRGVLGFAGLAGYYMALARLPLADATTLQNVTPMLTAFLAWWLLGERVGWSTFLALGCGICGVLMIVHPSGGGLDPIGVFVAIAGATCSAIAYVTVRRLSRTEHPLVIVFYFPMVATPLAIPWAAASWVTPSPVEVLLLIAIGMATQLGQVFLTMALSVERAGRASSVGFLQVTFAMGWQLIIFGQAPTAFTILGAALIVAGTLAVAGTSPRAEPPPAEPSQPA